MHYISLISTTLLAFAAASAIPGTTPVSVNPLTKREEKIWNPKGNIKLTFSDKTVNIGGIKVDDIIAKLGSVCHESGQCETNKIEMKTLLGSSSSLRELKVTLGPDGTYPVWIRNGLIDILGRAVKEIVKCTDGEHTQSCGGVSAMAWCPKKKTPYTNCEVPQFWGINYQHPGSENEAPPAIAVDIGAKVSDVGICRNGLRITGSVAGAVNGVAGSVFTLLSYACS